MAKNIIAAIAIIAACLIVYSNSVGGKFLWDDDYLVKYNTYIKDFSRLKETFATGIGGGSGRVFGFYRPIQIVTYTADHFFWGLDERGYHLTSMILHILASLSVWAFIRRISADPLVSFLSALLFAVHPVHVSAVAYISGRADPLFLLFTMLAFIFYLKCLDAGKRMSYFLMLACYALALLSKEHSLILPALILVYHASFRKNIALAPFLSVSAEACAYIAIRATILKHTLSVSSSGLSGVSERVPGLLAAFAEYVRLLILPFGLHAQYGNAPRSYAGVRATAGIIMITACVIWALRARRKSNPIAFFSILWFFTALIPVSNLFPVNAFMAEHWLYLPSIGFFTLIASAMGGEFASARLRAAAFAITVFILLFFSAITILQNRHWASPSEFFEHTLKFNPDNERALSDLARAYDASGRRNEAIALYKKSIALDPYSPIQYNNLGVTYHNMGDDKRAFACYQKALRILPGYPEANNNLGVIYEHAGRLDEAIYFYKRAVASNPNFAGARHNLENAYFKLKK